MKLNNFKKYQIIFFLLNILLYILTFDYANSQVIQIYSKYQSIDTVTNTIFFKDNVVFKYNQMELFAKKIMIIYDQETRYLSMVKAYGNPVFITYNQESECIISAQSSIAYYNVVDNIITFIGNARIDKSGSSIQSDNIIYLINQKKIHSISNKDNKSITILKINPV